MNNNELQPHEIRFFIGYSGWGEDQLESELEQNSWLISNQYNLDTIFLEEEEKLWKELVVSLGPRYAHMANFPENPMWN